MNQFVLLIVFLFAKVDAQSLGFPSQNHVHVFMPHNDVRYHTAETAELFCDYTLSGGIDQPVTVTWKKGGFIDGNPIFRCKGYTKTSKKCTSIEFLDENYYFRLGMAAENPSLIISTLDSNDASNYWCEIAVEGSTNYELEYDMRSVVIQLIDGNSRPKMGTSIMYKQDLTAYVGETKTMTCECLYETQGIYGDVYWYKGPSSDGNLELIYSISWDLYKGNPYSTETAHGNWIGRVSLVGQSLEVKNLLVEDSGRYWCECRPGEFQGTFIPYGIDAKSLVLEVVYYNCC